MNEKVLVLAPDCKIVYYTYSNPIQVDLSLEYVEHATDHWSSDNDTIIDIDKDKAIEIIEFLQEAFNIKTEKV